MGVSTTARMSTLAARLTSGQDHSSEKRQLRLHASNRSVILDTSPLIFHPKSAVKTIASHVLWQKKEDSHDSLRKQRVGMIQYI